MLFEDFDRSVRGIAAQPFLLKAEIDGRRRQAVRALLPPPNPIIGLSEHGHALANAIVTALEQTSGLTDPCRTGCKA
ncbi:hypothetical protein DL991_10580 [Amycolatopsis sp. WAC 01375]|uniref:hypothetical protein n=1 Tax=Amycolatopsis sp. WAC 01375 TaxID=2203194 RepID=UPI000F7753C3|nr:hypothetical protein [Amycolatopsis sp. WAC 01375]RSM80552.1 hypothetical protein DL991_10580 [Amycolatopsis sp. WAC 01375]